MRKLFLNFALFGHVALAVTAAPSAFVFDLSIRLVRFLDEVLVWDFGFIPRLVSHLPPARKILMSATALNGRQVGGVKVRGFLGRPAVMSLTG